MTERPRNRTVWQAQMRRLSGADTYWTVPHALAVRAGPSNLDAKWLGHSRPPKGPMLPVRMVRAGVGVVG